MRTMICLLLVVCPCVAQTVRLSEPKTGATTLAAEVGDTLTIEVSAHIGTLQASGVAVNIRLPAEGLSVVDAGHRPFRALAMFDEALEFANEYVREEDVLGLAHGSALLTYAVVLGPGTTQQRSRSGSGPIAAFDVVCTAPLDEATVAVVSNPVYESQIVLADGRSQRRLEAGAAVAISVPEPAARPVAGSWAWVKTGHAPD